jgi:uncharacterized protein Yka (UPF0111/DUF47 family)
MIDDLEGKTLEELKELEQQLAHAIDVMDEMRVSQIDSAVNAAGDAAKELTSVRHTDIRADINSRFLPSLDDLHNGLAACEKRIDRLTQNPGTNWSAHTA